MDLRSHYPFWLLKNGLMHEYPSLQEDLDTDIAILGGGITGALIAWQLVQAGREPVLIDGRHIGMGSTAASTAMLQYEIDTHLSDLTERIGRRDADRCYRLCIEAVDTLSDIVRNTGINAGFDRRPSLYFASVRGDVAALRREFEARRRIGIDIQLLERDEIRDLFGFDAPAALYSPANSAQVDAYALTHGLLRHAMTSGLTVYDKTRVERITYARGRAYLYTAHGQVIRAKHLVMATGYEASRYLPGSLISLHSTYALVSEPYPMEGLWHEDALIWETARPYVYMRTTSDRRILVGGRDEPFYDPGRRDRLLRVKTQALVRDFEKLFPHLGPLRVDFSWAGTFAETPDGLPYIGRIAGHPHAWFALGFGGNGILFSQIAAEILTAVICGRKHKDMALFGFDRYG